MNNIKEKNTYLKVLAITLFMSCALVATSSVAFALSASTSLTIVNVTDFPHGTVSSMTTWEGDWPNDPTDAYLRPEGYELYLKDVHFESRHMSWATVPAPTPYWPFRNTVNSMIAAVWSKDGGKTFTMLSWDYLARTTTAKGIEGGMPDCWMGTMIHTLCDRKAGECNGRFKSNLLFTEYPTGNTRCWGTVD